MELTVNQIAQHVDGEVYGNGDIKIYNAAKIEEAKQGDISFVANGKYESFAYKSNASALLVNPQFDFENSNGKAIILVDNVYQALSILLKKFEVKITKKKGISEQATLGEQIFLGEEVIIEEYSKIGNNCNIQQHVHISNNCSIGDNVSIGANTKIHPGVKIYQNCKIGENCVIHSNVVIGCDGFGFVNKEGQFDKIPQIGNVLIKDNVEIGSNTVIDRATIGSTIIHKGVKLDNLIQVAHNVVIGENTVIAAQTGIAGSSKIGKNCMIGGQVGIAGHLTIADGTQIQAQSGIASSIYEDNKKWYGFPAIPYFNYLRSFSIFKILPTLLKRIEHLEEKMDERNNE